MSRASTRLDREPPEVARRVVDVYAVCRRMPGFRACSASQRQGSPAARLRRHRERAVIRRENLLHA